MTAEAIECYVLVFEFFKDFEKTALWFNTNNPLLGSTPPMHMILMGREKKLLACIKNLLDGDLA